jgi:hypothetical protein
MYQNIFFVVCCVALLVLVGFIMVATKFKPFLVVAASVSAAYLAYLLSQWKVSP